MARPKSAAGTKIAQTFYLTPERHEQLKAATRALGKPITRLVEEVMSDWLDRNAKSVADTAEALSKIHWKK